MAKFKTGDLVNLLPYGTLVDSGKIENYGDDVDGVSMASYKSDYMGNPHKVGIVGYARIQLGKHGFAYPLWCVEKVDPVCDEPRVDLKAVDTGRVEPFDIPGSVNVMGVEYTVEVLPKLGDDESDGTGGFCDPDLKCIKLRDLTTIDEWKDEPIEKVRARMKMILRHEIVHAYLDESGLMYNSMVFGDGWAKNEEMTDWFAIQGPKIMETWKKAGCL